MSHSHDHSEMHASCVLTCSLRYILPAIAGYYMLKFTGILRFVQLKIQSKFFTITTKFNTLKEVISSKKELFKTLNNFKTKPVILEVGIADGRNFEFYPEGSHIIAIEPNVNSHKDLEHQFRKTGKHLHLDCVHADFAERLEHVQDASVDAYVLTHVTCSIKDLDAAFREAQRVLKPGGRLYIFHHFLGPSISSWSPVLLLERWFLFPLVVTPILECNINVQVAPCLMKYFPQSETKVLKLPHPIHAVKHHFISESVNK